MGNLNGQTNPGAKYFFVEQLDDIYSNLYDKYQSWLSLNKAWGLEGTRRKLWQKKDCVLITKEMIEELRSMGLMILLVPYDERVREKQGRMEVRKPVKNMSIYEIAKAAAAEGLTYGAYVEKYDKR